MQGVSWLPCRRLNLAHLDAGKQSSGRGDHPWVPRYMSKELQTHQQCSQACMMRCTHTPTYPCSWSYLPKLQNVGNQALSCRSLGDSLLPPPDILAVSFGLLSMPVGRSICTTTSRPGGVHTWPDFPPPKGHLQNGGDSLCSRPVQSGPMHVRVAGAGCWSQRRPPGGTQGSCARCWTQTSS